MNARLTCHIPQKNGMVYYLGRVTYPYISSSTGKGEEGAEGFGGDGEVEPEGAMLQIIQVKREFPSRARDICPAARRIIIIYLRPTRKAGSDKMAHAILRNFALIDLGDFRELWSRTDEREVAHKHIP